MGADGSESGAKLDGSQSGVCVEKVRTHVAVCFLTNPAEDNAPGRREEGYYLLIGADGVQEIQVSLPGSSGGVVNADGSFFKKGEEVYLAQLQNITDLRGVSITALGKNGEIIYALSIPEDASDAEIINIVGGDGWLLAPTEFADITASGGQPSRSRPHALWNVEENWNLLLSTQVRTT